MHDVAAKNADVRAQSFAQQLASGNDRKALGVEPVTFRKFASSRRHRRDGEPENTAFVRRVSNTNLAAHGIDQAFGDRKSKAGPSEPTRVAGIGLHEFVEDRAALFKWDADASVPNSEAEEVPMAALYSADINAHATFFGELYGISKQVR